MPRRVDSLLIVTCLIHTHTHARRHTHEYYSFLRWLVKALFKLWLRMVITILSTQRRLVFKHTFIQQHISNISLRTVNTADRVNILRSAGRRPITPRALRRLAAGCWYVCKPEHGRLLGVALCGCSCLDCTSWHFSVSMSLFALPLHHTDHSRYANTAMLAVCMILVSWFRFWSQFLSNFVSF